MKKRIIIGISGASGIPISVDILKVLAQSSDFEKHLVITDSGKLTLSYESKETLEDIYGLVDYHYDIRDMGAPIASGSFRTEGMIIAPCSMKTVAGIANGYTDNLLLRAADVMLKERKPLMLLVRETPFSRIHLRNMLELTNMGVDILPLVMTFYNNPTCINDMIRHLSCKTLQRFGIDSSDYKRWKDT